MCLVVDGANPGGDRCRGDHHDHNGLPHLGFAAQPDRGHTRADRGRRQRRNEVARVPAKPISAITPTIAIQPTANSPIAHSKLNDACTRRGPPFRPVETICIPITTSASAASTPATTLS